MTLFEIIEKLRDGKRYTFSVPNLGVHFHKAPYPTEGSDEIIDGACSSITCWRDGERYSPTFLLSDFDSDEWNIEELNSRSAIVGGK